MKISAEDKAKLVSLARAAVESVVTGSAPPEPSKKTGLLGERLGCFVTLTNSGRLRGCIGTFQPQSSLVQTIIEMGQAAAADPRFPHDRISPSELDELTVEVSVLSPLVETDDPQSLEIGKHGIYVMTAMGSGCFLPEVATDMGWSAEEFLSHCCQGKAGVSPNAWRSSDARVYLFTSEKFDH